MTARLLVIAGSDSSAGAGLQADLKTAQHFGGYAQTVVTAVTAQDTRGVHAVQVMPPDLVRLQMELALNDIGADAIKIGMLGDGAVASAVADVLADFLSRCKIPLVLDPVILSSSGATLLDDAGIAVLKTRLLPITTLLTPNLPEVEKLVGIAPTSDHGLSDHGLRNAMQAFRMLGVAQVLFKDGHGSSAMVRDVLAEGDTVKAFESPRQDTRHTHGTGCTLATAIACGLAEGLALAPSVERAHAFVQTALRTAPGLGGGHGPLNHTPTG